MSRSAHSLNGVSFVDENNGWVVGASGTILHTTNGGRGWSLQFCGTTRNLFSAVFLDASRGWIVGENGTIVKTNDGGATWSAQASGTTNNLNSIFFTDYNTGYAVGDNGTILKTSDGGTVGITEKPAVSHRSSVVSYPNPFSSSTNFKYTVEEPGMVTLEVCNQVGQIVANLVNEQQTSGTYQVLWNAEGMPAGVYFYSLTAGKQADRGKMVIMR